MIKALLIGCGNMGAGYDLDDASKVWTHAKAYSLRNDIELSIFDQDSAKAKQIANKYEAFLLESLQNHDYSKYQIISITTPTPTHFHFLEKIIEAKVPVVICEKPVVNEISQVKQLEQLYTSGNSKILVNYIRRFQNGYKIAKEKILKRSENNSLKGIIIKYRRGFLNNASHAIDLLEYFFESPFDFKNYHCTSAIFDAFDYDPTVTAACTFLDVPVSFAGFATTSYAIFELEFFFSASKMVICHSGNEIRYYYDDNGTWNEHLEERQASLIDTYMVPVIDTAVDLYNGKGHDNFMSSLRLNKAILETIEPLKKKSNATSRN